MPGTAVPGSRRTGGCSGRKAWTGGCSWVPRWARGIPTLRRKGPGCSTGSISSHRPTSISADRAVSGGHHARSRDPTTGAAGSTQPDRLDRGRPRRAGDGGQGPVAIPRRVGLLRLRPRRRLAPRRSRASAAPRATRSTRRSTTSSCSSIPSSIAMTLPPGPVLPSAGWCGMLCANPSHPAARNSAHRRHGYASAASAIALVLR